MKKKEEIYVVIDTPKKAKKVKKLLDMFRERIERYTNDTLSDYNQHWTTAGEGVPALFYSNRSGFIGEHVHNIKGKTEVSIKELRNILALEHLKEGDVVVTKVNNEKIIAIYDHACKSNLALFQSKRWVRVSDGFKWNNEGCFDTFIRYATEEEKALLEDKQKLEVGKWYKHANGEFPNWIVFYGEKSVYGFAASGTWFETNGYDYEDMLDYMTEQFLEEATKEEVEQALIKEAKNRYKVGDKVRSLVAHSPEFNISEHKYMQFSEISDLWVRCSDVNALVFRDGKWAEIVEPVTVKPVINGKDLQVVLDGKPLRCESNIGKRVRVIDGGYGAKGCDGKVGVIVDRSSVDFSSYGGACSTDRAECYIMTEEGYYWGLCEGYELEYLTESSPLTVTLEIKDIATLQVIQKTLKELEEKLTKLI